MKDSDNKKYGHWGFCKTFNDEECDCYIGKLKSLQKQLQEKDEAISNCENLIHIARQLIKYDRNKPSHEHPNEWLLDSTKWIEKYGAKE